LNLKRFEIGFKKNGFEKEKEKKQNHPTLFPLSPFGPRGPTSSRGPSLLPAQLASARPNFPSPPLPLSSTR
jgi:hypothetical protein